MSAKEAELQALVARLNAENELMCDERWRLQNDLTAAKRSLDETTVALAEATQRAADLTAEVTALRAETKLTELSRGFNAVLAKPHLVVDNADPGPNRSWLSDRERG